MDPILNSYAKQRYGMQTGVDVLPGENGVVLSIPISIFMFAEGTEDIVLDKLKNADSTAIEILKKWAELPNNVKSMFSATETNKLEYQPSDLENKKLLFSLEVSDQELKDFRLWQDEQAIVNRTKDFIQMLKDCDDDELGGIKSMPDAELTVGYANIMFGEENVEVYQAEEDDNIVVRVKFANQSVLTAGEITEKCKGMYGGDNKLTVAEDGVYVVVNAEELQKFKTDVMGIVDSVLKHRGEPSVSLSESTSPQISNDKNGIDIADLYHAEDADNAEREVELLNKKMGDISKLMTTLESTKNIQALSKSVLERLFREEGVFKAYSDDAGNSNADVLRSANDTLRLMHDILLEEGIILTNDFEVAESPMEEKQNISKSLESSSELILEVPQVPIAPAQVQKTDFDDKFDDRINDLLAQNRSNILYEGEKQYSQGYTAQPLEKLASVIIPSEEHLKQQEEMMSATQADKITDVNTTAKIIVDADASNISNEKDLMEAIEELRQEKISANKMMESTLQKVEKMGHIVDSPLEVSAALISPGLPLREEVTKKTKSSVQTVNAVQGVNLARTSGQLPVQTVLVSNDPVILPAALINTKTQRKTNQNPQVPAEQVTFEALVRQLIATKQHASKRNFIRKFISKIKGEKNYSFTDPNTQDKVRVKFKKGKIIKATLKGKQFDSNNARSSPEIERSICILNNILQAPKVVDAKQYSTQSKISSNRLINKAKILHAGNSAKTILNKVNEIQPILGMQALYKGAQRTTQPNNLAKKITSKVKKISAVTKPHNKQSNPRIDKK